MRIALLDAGLSPESFQLEGVHEREPIPPDFWFLRRDARGRWEVGPYERGSYDVRAVFDSEADACAALFRALTGQVR